MTKLEEIKQQAKQLTLGERQELIDHLTKQTPKCVKVTTPQTSKINGMFANNPCVIDRVMDRINKKRVLPMRGKNADAQTNS